MSSSLTSVLADPGRLAAVRQTKLLDSPAEDAFDRVARMAARLLEVPIALVPLIEDDRQLFKACVGLPEPWASARQTPLSHSLCQHVVVARQPLAIGDTGGDARARDNPLVRELGLAAYLGVPLIDAAGYAVGSVCVADHRPRDWTPDQLLAALADARISRRTADWPVGTVRPVPRDRRAAAGPEAARRAGLEFVEKLLTTNFNSTDTRSGTFRAGRSASRSPHRWSSWLLVLAASTVRRARALTIQGPRPCGGGPCPRAGSG